MVGSRLFPFETKDSLQTGFEVHPINHVMQFLGRHHYFVQLQKADLGGKQNSAAPSVESFAIDDLG